MNLLKQLISDGEMPSTMRVMTLAIVLPVMLVWTILCIRQNAFVAIPVELIGLLVAALGAKAAQSKFEQTPAPIRVTGLPGSDGFNQKYGQQP